MRDSAKHGSASSGGWLSPLILPLCYFWRWKSEEGASGWDDAEETRKQREQVDVFSPISFTTQTLIRRMWPFPVKRIIKIFWLIGSEKGEAGRNAVVFCKVIDKSHSWFFFFLFDVDHFQSLYWICYSIASVFCFACGILAALSEIEPTPTPLEGEVLTTGGGFSVPKSCPTLCDPTDWNMPGMPVLYYLLEVAQTHMSIESTMPSSLPLSLPALNLSQHQDLYQWVGSSHQDCHCITREVPTFVIFDLTCPWPSSFLRAPFLLQQRERERDQQFPCRPGFPFLRIPHKEKSESEVTQSCLTLCNPMDCSPPRFSIHGIFQARVLDWVAISFSRGSSWPRDRTWVSCVVSRCFTVWATREVEEAIN